jgi:hypothetical protein
MKSTPSTELRRIRRFIQEFEKELAGEERRGGDTSELKEYIKDLKLKARVLELEEDGYFVVEKVTEGLSKITDDARQWG